jgi:hypothetical protein
MFVFSLILFASILVNIKPVYSATASLCVDPAIITKATGESLKVNISVTAAEYLYAWQANVSYNPAVLECVNVTEGEFLGIQPDGTFGAKTIKNEKGWALFGWSTLGEYIGVSGSGTLATMEFDVIATGESLIKIETEAYNMSGQITVPTYMQAQASPNPPPNFYDIVFTAENGFFTNTLTPPVASFTYSPENPVINEAITFNASASTATSPLEIAEYYWDFGDGENTTVATTTVEHTYTIGGAFTVSLTVIDNATASELVESTFNTTGMPWVWYELYSTYTEVIEFVFPHDIAVTNVTPSKTEAAAGETVSITVVVLNKGSETETFDVTAYYGTNEIDTKNVADLSHGEEETLTFDWTTSGVAEGEYQVKAYAPPVEGETSVNDNEFLDGTVTITASTGEFPIMYAIIGGIAVVAVLAILVFYMRRKSA